MNRKNFTQTILSWYDQGHRDLPWRRTQDPYRIWISEIMLQQTRAETVVSYYERFLARYPTVQDLASAPEEELLKAWEGLGYYSRARSLQKAAKEIVARYGGQLPADLEKLRALPGIGDYTAGAIASIAFGIPAAAVDGNVERVLCRWDAIKDEVGTPTVRRQIAARAQALVPPDRPGAFANAMMEMGATMCTPKNPKCLLCPVREGCMGFAQGIAQELPRKAKKKAQRVENRAVLLVFCDNRVLIVKRQEKLLGGLFVFPDVLEESDPARLCQALEALGIRAAYDEKLGHARHVFTHLIWEMDVHAVVADEMTQVPGGQWVSRQELAALPLPTAVKAARQWAMERLTE
ncbi:MAG: A/G-specific adenine glycosylase [Candidatus Ventricola sp.]|nr:A/G-specific adenine glycosylase [Candidatus Ventricola sp.]MDY3832961.1 A/G-specific adenine glycosylase [Candidatus Ventricola sp.]